MHQQRFARKLDHNEGPVLRNDSEYRYYINPIRPLQTVGGDETVIYLGTVSKTLAPTLRLGYPVIPHGLRQVFCSSKRLADRHTPRLEQEALADLLANGTTALRARAFTAIVFRAPVRNDAA